MFRRRKFAPRPGAIRTPRFREYALLTPIAVGGLTVIHRTGRIETLDGLSRLKRPMPNVSLRHSMFLRSHFETPHFSSLSWTFELGEAAANALLYVTCLELDKS
jgi:hypothetical protein